MEILHILFGKYTQKLGEIHNFLEIPTQKKYQGKQPCSAMQSMNYPRR
jgi:hypothetical protein